MKWVRIPDNSEGYNKSLRYKLTTLIQETEYVTGCLACNFGLSSDFILALCVEGSQGVQTLDANILPIYTEDSLGLSLGDWIFIR